MSKREKVTLLILANPERPWHELCIEAGYSKKRARVTASELRRDANFQAKLAALRDKKLSAEPTRENYFSLVRTAVEMAERGDPLCWVPMRAAEHFSKALPQQPDPKPESTVVVTFVEPPQLAPEVAGAINESAAKFEAKMGLVPGSMGRNRVEPQPEPEPLRPGQRQETCSQHGPFVAKQNPRNRAWSICPECIADASEYESWLGAISAGRVN